jgi:HD-GYP domain-containing protein (c-di-GMP phosphodiesterase class II)
MAGEELGFSADRLQRLEWAALIHDLGRLAIPGDLLHRDAPLTRSERRRALRHQRVVDDVLAEVEFLRPMVEAATAVHRVLGGFDGPEEVTPETGILAAAHVFDARTSTRSYRAAVTQAEAFAGLRADAARFGPGVVDALTTAIERRGEVYGSPEERVSAEVERLVRERAVRA